jgi:hypothetical protein
LNPATVQPPTPVLSVILTTAGRFADVRVTVRHLQRQTIAARIELILLAPKAGDFGMAESDTSRFLRVQLVELPQVTTVAAGNAVGVTHATAEVVVFSEDHAFPQPTWAEALVERHRENWVAVGPVVANGNPATAASWADYLLGYGPWHEGHRGGSVSMLPGHNSSYKRAALLKFGPDLPRLLVAETVLQERLVTGGGRLFLEPRARISHLNFGRLGVFLAVQFHSGRQFAASRVCEWSLAKRLGYAVGSPLIPLVRLFRTVRFGVRLPNRPARVAIASTLTVGLLVDAIGQFLGYIAGSGSSPQFLTEFEYRRVRFIRPEDRIALERA